MSCDKDNSSPGGEIGSFGAPVTSDGSRPKNLILGRNDPELDFSGPDAEELASELVDDIVHCLYHHAMRSSSPPHLRKRPNKMAVTETVFG